MSSNELLCPSKSAIIPAGELKTIITGNQPGSASVISGSLPTAEVMQQHTALGVQSAAINLGSSTHVALVVTPRVSGPIEKQLVDSVAAIKSVLKQQHGSHFVISQTVFLKNPEDQSVCERLFAASYGPQIPVTTFVFQPPCDGASIAIVAWSVGGESVRVEWSHPQLVSVFHDGLEWLHCGLPPRPAAHKVYESVTNGLRDMQRRLTVAGSAFDHVIRLWLFLGDIHAVRGNFARYMELNRARSDFYRRIRFTRRQGLGGQERVAYPASTGVGMCGSTLAMSTLALNSARKDVFLLPIENPRQTPAYLYPPRYSPKSPKFARAIAVVIGNEVVTWLSGTASILNSESQHIDDLGKQIDQTIRNIEALIAPSNFEAHGLAGVGAKLTDFVQLRVYVKRPQDYPICRDICAAQFGKTPILYTVADVCRPDLLVEIEGVLFTRRATGA